MVKAQNKKRQLQSIHVRLWRVSDGFERAFSALMLLGSLMMMSAKGKALDLRTFQLRFNPLKGRWHDRMESPDCAFPLH